METSFDYILDLQKLEPSTRQMGLYYFEIFDNDGVHGKII